VDLNLVANLERGADGALGSFWRLESGLGILLARYEELIVRLRCLGKARICWLVLKDNKAIEEILGMIVIIYQVERGLRSEQY
jgi:hypothetical protein